MERKTQEEEEKKKKRRSKGDAGLCSCQKAGLVGLLSVFHWPVFTLTAGTVQEISCGFWPGGCA